MTKKQQVLASVLSVVVMLELILLTRRVWFRLDLTANKAYTLSAASKKLRGEIGETVRLTYYLSDKLRSIDPAPAEIADFLREYEAGSGGAIQVAVKDPASQAGAAERYGLQSQQLQNVEADEASFSLVYSGIVIEYLDKAEILPWVFSLDTLEYDVTSRIRSLLSGKKRELGVLAPEAQRNWSEYYGFFNQVLSLSGFSVLPLSAADEIPDTLPVLLVLGGAEELSGAALYRIDRYLRLGGRVLFMVETVQVDFYGSTWEARPKEDGGLLGMISWYGATLENGLVLDKAALPLPYQDPVTGEMRLVRYAPWVGVLGENAGDTILTSTFGGADLFWASPITITAEPETVKAEILFTSTDQAWLMTRDFQIMPAMNSLFGAEEEETRGKRILAVALEGRFPSWFAGQEKPVPEGGAWEGDEWRETVTALPDMPDEAKETRIIVVGDADMGGALVQYTQTQSPLNFNFLLQAIDWLGNDDDIVGIRSRAGTGRLDKIQDEQERARAMNFSRLLNVFIVPLAILVFGVFRVMNRTKRIRGGHNGRHTPKARDAAGKEETGHAVS
ncbi:MAG: Gldg family protein [Treponema sp.]|jgi:ABC-type uncharacterized transport system involved in gliding motility auxiliary subunit|nr:Gldg family protein [Treponema sp.]